MAESCSGGIEVLGNGANPNPTAAARRGVFARAKSRDVSSSTQQREEPVSPKRHSLGTVEESSPSRARPKLLKLPFLDEIKTRRVVSPTPQKPSKGLPFIQELALYRKRSLGSRERSRGSRSRGSESLEGMEMSRLRTSSASSTAGPDDFFSQSKVLKEGTLVKQSRSKDKPSPHGFPRPRKFRLTTDSLDMLHTFSHVKVKRSYPLTAVESLDYKDGFIFELTFSTYVLILQAESEDDAQQWVEKISEAWAMWKVEPEPEEILEEEEEEEVEEIVVEIDEVREKGQDQESISDAAESTGEESPQRLGTAPSPHSPQKEPLKLVAPPPPATPDPPTSRSRDNSMSQAPSRSPVPSRFQSSPQPRPRSSSSSAYYRHRGTSETAGTESRGRRLSRKAFRLARLKPKFERMDYQAAVDPDRDHDSAQDRLHQEFPMIKYPTKILRLPAERVFKVDSDNLQILWRTLTRTGYRQKSSLSLRRIVEVRKGQQTAQFDKFPYEQVEDKSFSLLFESETNKYARLASLDVICDHKDSFNSWMDGLDTLVTGTQWLNLFPRRYQFTDPTILWLKQIWACKTDREMKEVTAIRQAKKFLSHMSQQDAKVVVWLAHAHQVKQTFGYGAALQWDGFVLLHHLLCDRTNLQLYNIFLSYAKQHQYLGLTREEFRNFLIKECHWRPVDTKPSVLVNLMKNHDEEHHQAIKKFYAGNRPQDYQTSLKLLSFAGFLSFLRSRDNSVINLEHETVYQDMTQPLSHYFINSSHNTYLEGDQLTGTSSTDAYVRALLQGCRCIEIDCWDDVLNVTGLQDKEPVIYHGHTLTTKIPFRDVIHAINDYGFSSSVYPIIISIENHCSSAQQSKMAKIFRAIFEERLPSENLVETEGRKRLPSPEELQGKVILKGAVKKGLATGNRLKKKLTQAAGIFSSIDPTSSLQSATKKPVTKKRAETTAHVEPDSDSLVTGTKNRANTTAADSSNGVDPEASITFHNVRNIQKQAAPSSVEDLYDPAFESFAISTKKPHDDSSIGPLSASSLTRGDVLHESLRGRSNTDSLLTPGGHRRAWSFGSKRYKHRKEQRNAGQEAGGEDFTDTGGNLVGLNRINRRSVRLREIRDRLQQCELGQDDQELSFTETADDLNVLIVYCKSTSIKPWDWSKQKKTAICDMFSFGEPTAVELCRKFPKDVLCCSERQLVRTYPKGTRFDSSNYDPMQMWECGVQMVALNFQYPGIDMHLNQGFFRLNGGCGYVLKPEVMRQKDPGNTEEKKSDSATKAPYSPDMTAPHPSVTPVWLEVELLSGQRLSQWNKKCSHVTVDIQTYGIKHDCNKMKFATHSNPFWPSWGPREHVLKQQIIMPELCLVYFRVENEGRKVYGQNCFPLISLLPGIKFVPLRTNGGEVIPESGLFVRIRKFEGEGPPEGEEEELKDADVTSIPEEDLTAIGMLSSLSSPTESDVVPLNVVTADRQRRVSSPAMLNSITSQTGQTGGASNGILNRLSPGSGLEGVAEEGEEFESTIEMERRLVGSAGGEEVATVEIHFDADSDSDIGTEI